MKINYILGVWKNMQRDLENLIVNLVKCLDNGRDNTLNILVASFEKSEAYIKATSGDIGSDSSVREHQAEFYDTATGLSTLVKRYSFANGEQFKRSPSQSSLNLDDHRYLNKEVVVVPLPGANADDQQLMINLNRSNSLTARSSLDLTSFKDYTPNSRKVKNVKEVPGSSFSSQASTITSFHSNMADPSLNLSSSEDSQTNMVQADSNTGEMSNHDSFNSSMYDDLDEALENAEPKLSFIKDKLVKHNVVVAHLWLLDDRTQNTIELTE